MEKQIVKKEKALQINIGGDLCGKSFDELFKKCGIAWQNTTPYASK